jgi:hypothetical protein
MRQLHKHNHAGRAEVKTCTTDRQRCRHNVLLEYTTSSTDGLPIKKELLQNCVI